jgi:biotin carboxyl carrier protein
MAMIEIESPVTGTVWKLECAVGDKVSEGQVLLIIESMKMEIPIEASQDGVVVELKVAADDAVEEDQIVCTLEV